MSAKRSKQETYREGTYTESTVNKDTADTVIKTLSLGGGHGGGCPAAVDVRDGRILRIRPLHYNWKYSMEKFNPWEFKRNGKTLKPVLKSPFNDSVIVLGSIPSVTSVTSKLTMAGDAFESSSCGVRFVNCGSVCSASLRVLNE